MDTNTAGEAIPFFLLVVLAAWGALMKSTCKFQTPPNPLWPFAANPGLSLELADGLPFATAVLGEPGTNVGTANRLAAARLQKLDFVFIPLYVTFFIAVARQLSQTPLFFFAAAFALLAGLFDVIEDLQILGLLHNNVRSSPKRFGQSKWFFYFLTLFTEGVLFFISRPNASAKSLAAMAFGAFLMANGIGGIVSSLKGSFTGILSGSTLSGLGLIGLAVAPLIAIAPLSWHVAAEYVILLRVPLIFAALLFLLPVISFFTGARSLLRGLFDLTPLSLFVVTLTALAAAGTSCMTASIVLFYAHYRVGIEPISGWLMSYLKLEWAWLLIVFILAAPVVAFALWFSTKQGRGFGRLVLALLAGSILFFPVASFLITSGPDAFMRLVPFLPGIKSWFMDPVLFAGYNEADAWQHHMGAAAAFFSSLILYIAVGIYGYLKLGKTHTVPALCSALMLMLMLDWPLSAVAFFFDAFRIPILLILGALGTLTAQSARSDHFYDLRRRRDDSPAPGPTDAILATARRQIIVVTANGGGIQASAWAARVLQGLDDDCKGEFRRALRAISSVSGGSVGAASFIHWLANPATAKPPAEAAAESSLDEVGWGLAWPDFLKSLAPWIFGDFIGRGRALEKAWRLNSARNLSAVQEFDEPLSNWNRRVASGELPGLIMNATIVESGERLLLATTTMGHGDIQGRARVDATELHTINGETRDVGIATAARLSASFPYVTPASRSNGPGPQPHVVDGGYYDNYGMATMVEWLNDALTGAAGAVTEVLVIQILGSPVSQDLASQRYGNSHGWFYQAIAPFTTLVTVRGAGQAAHNDIELEFLQNTWAKEGIRIRSVPFEFHNPNVPLSWHLTPEEVAEIDRAWREDMKSCREEVKAFLGGRYK